MSVHRVEGSDPLYMECDLCGLQAPFDDALPLLNQTVSLATDHACPGMSAYRRSMTPMEVPHSIRAAGATWCNCDRDADRRETAADKRDDAADCRDRQADCRDSQADRRDARADRRDAAADRRDCAADRRDAARGRVVVPRSR